MSQRLTHRGAPKIDTARKKMMTRVREAFDADVLADICVRDDFTSYAPRIDLPRDPRDPGHERFYHYIDNGSDVLAIAHLDSVQDDGICSVVDTAGGLLAVSGTLDDRLGAYVILDLLPRLGITCDWLLTTDEEIGASTAGDFRTTKNYNWMFSFDRGGTDVVMYQYETDEFAGLVEDSGARVGLGSYSDICLLDDLECAGFNWGVGYQDYHGPRSHAWLEDTFRMVSRFVKFYGVNAETYLPHDRYVDEAADYLDLWDDLDDDVYLRDDDRAELRQWFEQAKGGDVYTPNEEMT